MTNLEAIQLIKQGKKITHPRLIGADGSPSYLVLDKTREYDVLVTEDGLPFDIDDFINDPIWKQGWKEFK